MHRNPSNQKEWNRMNQHRGFTTSYALILGLCSLVAGCSDGDPTGSGGEGTASFTTWGEEYIQDEIPEDPGDGSGFIDGWTVRYSKFLVNIGNIAVSNQAGEIGG